MSGDIQWIKPLDWLDVPKESLILDDNSIYEVGQNNNGDNGVCIYQSNFHGDSLNTIKFNFPDSISQNLILGSYGNGVNIFLSGRYNTNNDENNKGFIASFDYNLIHEKTVFVDSIDSLGRGHFLHEIREDELGNIVVLFEASDSIPNSNQVKFSKGIMNFDNNLNIISYWKTESLFNSFVVGNDLELLSNGNIIIKNALDDPTPDPIVECYNNQGVLQWQFNLNTSTEQFEIVDIKRIENDEILISGAMTSLSKDILGTGFLIKLDSQGQELWRRFYLNGKYPQIASSSLAGKEKFSVIFSIVENDNSLLAVGRVIKWWENDVFLWDPDFWLLNMDNEGCVVEENCLENQYVSSSSTLIHNHNVNIYPNPSRDDLFIESEDLLVENILIMDVMGSVLFQSDPVKNKIDISTLQNGIYHAVLLLDSKQKIVKRFVKI